MGEGKPQSQDPLPGTAWGSLYLCGPKHTSFDAPAAPETERNGWKKLDADSGTVACKPFETYYLMQEVESPRQQRVIAEIGAGNGIEVCVNGVSIMKHLNPYRCSFRKEQVAIPLRKGKNCIVIRLYNRFENRFGYLFRTAEKPVTYKQEITLPEILNGKSHTVTVKPHKPASPHTDAELSNLRIRLRRIAM